MPKPPAATEFPTEAHYWSKTGEAYSEARMFEQSELILGEAASRFPDDRWISYQRVIVARRRADWDEALRRAETLRAAWPQFWPAWVESGALTRWKQRFTWQRFMKDFSRVVERAA